MSSKHTPGPWKVSIYEREPFERNTATVTTTDKEISFAMICPGSCEGEYSDLSLENAALIAAAPDLLEACQQVLAWFNYIKTDQYEKLIHNQTLESASKNWDKLDMPEFDFKPLMDAINKATGGK